MLISIIHLIESSMFLFIFSKILYRKIIANLRHIIIIMKNFTRCIFLKTNQPLTLIKTDYLTLTTIKFNILYVD